MSEDKILPGTIQIHKIYNPLLKDEVLTFNTLEKVKDMYGKFKELDLELNKAKSVLDDIKDHNEMAMTVDMFFQLKRRLKEEFNFKVSTNASMKMYEMIVQLQLITVETRRMKVFCNAEFPGAFIVAINHYVMTQCPEDIDFNWVASSYYPESAIEADYMGIFDDKYGLYEMNKEKWLMGPDETGKLKSTGDLLNTEVLKKLAERAREINGEIDLYTSDAGTDVSDDYNNQEVTTALLNYGQILCGLLALSPGGTLVTKQYTFNTLFSRSLIALLSTLFDDLSIVKPVTSRPLNSEVYLVGKGYRGMDLSMSHVLLGIHNKCATEGVSPCLYGCIIDPILLLKCESSIVTAAASIYQNQMEHLYEYKIFYLKNRKNLKGLRSRLSKYYTNAGSDWIAANPMLKLQENRQLKCFLK